MVNCTKCVHFFPRNSALNKISRYPDHLRRTIIGYCDLFEIPMTRTEQNCKYFKPHKKIYVQKTLWGGIAWKELSKSG